MGQTPFLKKGTSSPTFFKGDQVMKKIMYTLMAVTAALGLTAGFAHGQETRNKGRQLDERVHTLNSMADKHGDFNTALHNVSVETGVPMEQLKRMHDNHPDAGIGGIMTACVLADDTKESPERFLSRHINGKEWSEIARDNNVPIDRINGRLDKLENDLNRMAPTGRERGSQYRGY
jgi:hypothetical protein